jgi:hypothetical protein
MKGNKMRPTTTLRKAQLLASLAAVSAFAIAPMAAQAGTGSNPATGTLNGAGLTNTAPTFAPFTVGLTGVAQDAYAPASTWNVNDKTGGNKGWDVVVTAGSPVVNIHNTATPIVGGEGTGGSMTLSPIPLAPTSGNHAPGAPTVASGSGPLDTSGYTIDSAIAGSGQGSWDSTADSGIPGPTGNSLDVVIPGDASAGDFVQTVTFTSASRP